MYQTFSTLKMDVPGSFEMSVNFYPPTAHVSETVIFHTAGLRTTCLTRGTYATDLFVCQVSYEVKYLDNLEEMVIECEKGSPPPTEGF